MPAFQRAEFENGGAPDAAEPIYRPDGAFVGKERRGAAGVGAEFGRKDGNPAVENIDRRLRARRLRDAGGVGDEIDLPGAAASAT